MKCQLKVFSNVPDEVLTPPHTPQKIYTIRKQGKQTSKDAV